MSNVDVPPNNDSANNEIDDPVDGPTPDWMKMATSSGSEPSLTDDNMPDWLKDIKTGVADSPEESSSKNDDAFGGMSDLERLLAEEGIDLSNVDDDVPPEAAGMSARDWMISTSDDEMIRKRIGSDPLEESSPVVAEPQADPEPVASTADDPYEGMSDLERLLAEEGVDLNTVAEERPPEAEGMSARDWMISTSEDEMIRKWVSSDSIEESPPATAEEPADEEAELPDWLQGVEDEVIMEDSATASTMADDKMVVEDDLPDWLQQDSDDAFDLPVGEEDDKIVVADGLPDWLQEVEGETVDESAIDSAEATVEADEVMETKTEDEDLPDWLSEVEEEPVPEDTSIFGDSDSIDDKMIVEEDLPDWLQEVDDEPVSEPVTSTVTAEEDDLDNLVVAEDLPDWLQEVEEDEETEPLQPVAAPAIETEGQPQTQEEAAQAGETAKVTSIDDDGMVEEDELPDWLQEVETEGEDAAFGSEEEELFGEDAFDDGELPAWLTEVQAEAEDEDGFEPSEPSPEELETVDVDDSGLPDWLSEGEEELVTAEVAGEQVAAEMPAVESVAEIEDMLETSELPDWLQEEFEEDETEVFEAAAPDSVAETQPEPEPEAVAAEEELEAAPVDEPEPPEAAPEPQVPVPAKPDGVPDWLRKLREGSVQPAVEPEPEVETQPVVAPIKPSAAVVSAVAPAFTPPAPEVTPEPARTTAEIDLPDDPDESLAMARAASEEGDGDRAIQIYEALVNSGANLDVVISDLDALIRSNPSNYMLHQIKGDAMMKDGRLQGSLEAYRRALAKLTG
jgi:hypothetical protein